MQEQCDTALQAQQHTGHPLWRTVINLGLLTPQEMIEIIKAVGGQIQGPAYQWCDGRESGTGAGGCASVLP